MGALDVFGPRCWSRPELLGVDRLPGRVPLVPFPDAAGALAAARGSRLDGPPGGAGSPWWCSLDGAWSFVLLERPEDVTDELVVAGAPPDGWPWERLVVPAPWTSQLGGRDTPQYTNAVMPFAGVPFAVPERNPTGVYRRQVSIPSAWAGRRIVLGFGGAESMLAVWVNGVPIGLSKGSRLPAEFDVTDAVVPGAVATIVAVVVRWSDASYLEDQDQWWQAGLFRSVTLSATGSTHLADVRLDAEAVLQGSSAAADCGGRLRAAVEVACRGEDVVPGWTVRIDVSAPDGSALTSGEAAVPTMVGAHTGLFEGSVVEVDLPVPDAAWWSAERPALHTVVVTLVDPAGAVVEACADRVGFRTIEVRDRRLLVNGRSVLVAGVNRHEHHEWWGRTVPSETALADVRLMKQHNLNAVRCSHYPPDPAFLDLCDEVGLYVIDEADLETHHRLGSLCHDPRIWPAVVDRNVRMVQRDRNHACVIGWSLGNEAGYGAGHDAARAALRRLDPTRFVQYEGTFTLAAQRGELRSLVGDHPPTDVICPMYASVEDLADWSSDAAARGETRPLILCEYSHAMGNSNGGLAEYVEAFRTLDGVCGGFIWEWVDHGFRWELGEGATPGRAGWRYGGDFGERPHDANFCLDGLVSADRTPHPALTEVKALFAPIEVSFEGASAVADRAGVRLRIGYRATGGDTAQLRAVWRVHDDGETVADGTLEWPVLGPGEWAQVVVPVPAAGALPTLHPGVERWLAVGFELAAATLWAEVGHEVASWEHRLDVGRVPAGGRRVAPEGDAVVTLAPPELVVFRAAVDNDGVKAFVDRADVEPFFDVRHKPLGRWLALGLERPLVVVSRSVADTVVDGRVVRCIDEVLHPWRAPDVQISHRCTLRSMSGRTEATIEVEHAVDLPDELSDLPRIGALWRLPVGFDTVGWIGPGPGETAPDRMAAARVGRWRSSIDEAAFAYPVPQESGLRSGLRCLWLDGRAGRLTVVAGAGGGDLGLTWSVRRWLPFDLYAAGHLDDLPVPTGEAYLLLDARHRGVGTGSCGPDTVSEHRIPAGRHTWSYELRAATISGLLPPVDRSNSTTSGRIDVDSPQGGR